MGIHICRSKRKCCSIRATEQQLTWEEVETALETASRESIEEIQEQAIREAAEAVESGRGVVNIELKYKAGWNEAQRAEADAKVKALSEAITVKTSVDRRGTSAVSRYRSAYGKESVLNGYDVDHIIDLQLGGSDDIMNMKPLDRSVNRSLGVQIKNAIKRYPYGTVFGKFTIH